MRRLLWVILVSFCLFGCSRAVYINVQGDKVAQKIPMERIESTPGFDDTQWQHFFLYGWVPDERIIDAAKLCNGKEHIVAIKTKETFLEGLVTQAATVYINIYSPYDGCVVCDKSLEPEKKAEK